jgi:hypothetical protein
MRKEWIIGSPERLSRVIITALECLEIPKKNVTAILERVVQLSCNFFFFLKFLKFFFVLNYSQGGTAVISSSVLTGPVQ